MPSSPILSISFTTNTLWIDEKGQEEFETRRGKRDNMMSEGMTLGSYWVRCTAPWIG